jgi:hypothetical protein
MSWTETVDRLQGCGRREVVAAWTATLDQLVALAGDVAGELAAADATVNELVAENERLRAAAGRGVA